MPADPSTALTVATPPTTLERALNWATLPADERRRRAVAAAAGHDSEALVGLTDAYLTLHGRAGARASSHTRRVYATSVRILVAAWRQQNLLHPDRDAAISWVRSLETNGSWRKDGSVGPASPATLRVRLAGARMLYRALRWTGATNDDPFESAHAAPETTAPWDKRQPYTQAELETLLEAANAEERLILLLGAHAGLRISEICDLTWDDVQPAAGTLIVRHGKGGKRRQVTLSRSVVAALEALPAQPGAPILPLGDNGMRKRLRQLCLRSKVTYRGVHALRHAAGTRLVREGATLEDAARHLGHASLATAQIYAKWSDEQLKNTLGNW